MAKYRGKHPSKIHTVTSSSGVTVVRTNDGNLYSVSPKTVAGRRHMPRLGDDINALIASGDYAVVASSFNGSLSLPS